MIFLLFSCNSYTTSNTTLLICDTAAVHPSFTTPSTNTHTLIHLFTHTLTHPFIHPISTTSIGKFVRYMIHEIRNPTSIVASGLEMIREKVESLKNTGTNGTLRHVMYDSILDSLGDIEAANHIATEVLNDFLTFDKLKSRMLVIEPKFISTTTYVDASIRPFHLPAQQRGIELSCYTHMQTDELTDLQSSLLFVDESKVGQVIRNLLSNALKFSKKGGKIAVTTECIPIPPSVMNRKLGTAPASSDDDGIDVFALVTIDNVTYHCTKFMRLSVQDNGPGI